MEIRSGCLALSGLVVFNPLRYLGHVLGPTMRIPNRIGQSVTGVEEQVRVCSDEKPIPFTGLPKISAPNCSASA